MSSTEQNLSAVTITADSANIGAITSGSITNRNAVNTSTLHATGSALVGGNLNVNGSAQIDGTLLVKGGLSFNDVAVISDEGEFVIKGMLNAPEGADFGHETLITTQKFDGDVIEGVITANNIRATNRLIVGDSPLEINSMERKVKGDTFTATFDTVIAATLKAALARVETLNVTGKADIKYLEGGEASIELVKADELQVQKFMAMNELFTKGIALDGSAVVSGGITINGSGRDEGALVVNNYHAVFNNGIKVWSKEGALVQTLNIVGTTDTDGTSATESAANKYAFNTAIGVRSRFQGDVEVVNAKAIFDNTPVFAENITVAPLNSLSDTTALKILKTGEGWDVYVDSQVNYESVTTGDNDLDITTEEEIEEHAAAEYEGKAVDITSQRNAYAAAKARSQEMALQRKARAISVAEQAKAFKIKSGATHYRLDAGGNILVKNAVAENIKASNLTVHSIVANDFKTTNLELDNISVVGRMQTGTGITVAGGTSEVSGKVYNYADTTHKHEAATEFLDQSTATFKDNTTLKIGDGASFITDEDANVSLRGDILLDLSKLRLYNPVSGKQYRLTLRDAQGEEGVHDGDIAMQIEVISQEEPPVAETTDEPPTAASTARARATLRADLEEFQEKLRRI